MPILVAVSMMSILIFIGKRQQAFPAKEYFFVFLVTLAQVLYFAFIFWTMEQPPLY